MKLLIFAILFPIFSVNGQPGFDKKIAQTAKQLTCVQPDEKNPVTLNAQLVTEGDSLAIIVKATIAPGWHIYAYVPQTEPYIMIDPILKLPENIKAIGEWKKTEPEASSIDKGVLIYENEAVFIHKAVKLTNAPGGLIKTGLYYQTCNLRQCLPPDEKTFELKY
jgi:hypothetical protein